MGLFGGSKSYSTSTTQQFQETNTQNSNLSGVVANSPVLTGSGNILNQSFSKEVAGAFENLADLAGESIKNLATNSTTSLEAVIEANQQVQNPAYNALAETANKVIPLAMFGIGALVVIKLVPKMRF